MNPINKIIKAIEALAPTAVNPNTAMARATSINLGKTRTRAQMNSLKKF